MTRRQWTLALAACGLTAWGAHALQPRRTVVVSASDDLAAFRDHLQAAGDTKLLRRALNHGEPDSDDGVVATESQTCATFGPLDRREAQRIHAQFVALAQTAREQLATHLATRDASDLEQLIREHELRVNVAIAEAEADVMARGKYWVVGPGDETPRQLQGAMVFFNNPAMHQGRPVDVVIPILLEEYPALVAAQEDNLAAHRFVLDTRAGEFNNLSLADRKLAVAASKQAQKSFDGPPPEGLDPYQVYQWKLALRKQILPWQFELSEHDYRVTVGADI